MSSRCLGRLVGRASNPSLGGDGGASSSSAYNEGPGVRFHEHNQQITTRTTDDTLPPKPKSKKASITTTTTVKKFGNVSIRTAPRTTTTTANTIKSRTTTTRRINTTNNKNNQRTLSPKVPVWSILCGFVGAVTTALILILYWSPYNYFAPRRIFVFPLLTANECQAIIDMAEQAALLNYQQAQQWSKTFLNHNNDDDTTTTTTTATKNDQLLFSDAEMLEASTPEERFRTMLLPPYGWHKLRHGSYPTTDLNLITDPFSKDNRTYLGDLLDRRLSPTLERIYGIPQRAFRATDMFVVRYDEGIRTHLERHTDDGDVSFTILVNDDFEGGGTRFWKRTHQTTKRTNNSTTTTTTNPQDLLTTTSFGHVQPTRVGTVVTNHALINHEGYPISRGTRIILVGFINVDRLDPWTGAPAGLGWSFASWWNLAWLNVTFKNGYFNALDRHERRRRKQQAQWQRQRHEIQWFDHPSIRNLFADLSNLVEYLGDVLAPHQIECLVAEDQANNFLQALDEAYYYNNKQRTTNNAKTQGKDEDRSNESLRQQKANWWKEQMVTWILLERWNPSGVLAPNFETCLPNCSVICVGCRESLDQQNQKTIMKNKHHSFVSVMELVHMDVGITLRTPKESDNVNKPRFTNSTTACDAAKTIVSLLLPRSPTALLAAAYQTYLSFPTKLLQLVVQHDIAEYKCLPLFSHTIFQIESGSTTTDELPSTLFLRRRQLLPSQITPFHYVARRQYLPLHNTVLNSHQVEHQWFNLSIVFSL